MQISWSQKKQLEDALLDAFREPKSLARLVGYGLGKNISEITSQANSQFMIFEIIDWADSYDKVDDLINAALEQNGNNLKVKALSAWLPQVGAPKSVSTVEAHGTPAGSYQQWFDELVGIGFAPQIANAVRVLRAYRVAAFLVEGTHSEAGQQMLAQLLTQLPRRAGAGKHIRIEVGMAGRWASPSTLWRLIAEEVGLKGEIRSELILNRVIECWESQHTTILFNTVDMMVARKPPPPTYLTEWITNFWKALVTRAGNKAWRDPERNAEDETRLLLILVDYSGTVATPDTGVELAQNESVKGYPHMPMRLTVPDRFELDTLQHWLTHLTINTRGTDNPPDIPDFSAQQLRDLSDGVPIRAYEELCKLCKWEGAIEKWRR